MRHGTRKAKTVKDQDPIETLRRAVAAMDLIDLTHPLAEGMPVWPGHPHFCQRCISSVARGDASSFCSLALGEHTGTHFDAPLHFIAEPAGRSIAETPIAHFFGRMLTLRVSCHQPGSAVEPETLRRWEAQHDPIATGDAVFFHFGWDRFWNDDYAAFVAGWPGLSQAASEMLVERGVRIVGSDCLSIDCFDSATFPAHRTLLGAGVLVGENFSRLGSLPPVCYLTTLPLPIVNGSGSPLRAIALVPRPDDPSHG
jgi:kynurenine formamidase